MWRRFLLLTFFVLGERVTGQHVSLCQNIGSIYHLSMQNLDGNVVSLKAFKGKYLMIVNVATFWGFTPQYLQMNALLKQQGNSRFDFLAFPCNQFGWQEPGDNRTEILNGLKYVRPGKGFEPNFEMMAKIDVNGRKESPLYTFLKKSCRSPRGAKFNKERLAWDIIKADDITWNFEKFLINIDGVPVARFLPEKTPEYIFNLLVPLINSNWTSVYSLPDLLRERCQNGDNEFCNAWRLDKFWNIIVSWNKNWIFPVITWRVDYKTLEEVVDLEFPRRI